MAESWREEFLKDTPLFGACIGAAASLGKDLFSYLLSFFGLSGHYFWELAAGMFISLEVISEPSSVVIGLLANLIVGALLGILFLYLLKMTGVRFIITKGLLFGLFVWVAVYGVLRAWHITSVAKDRPVHVLFAVLAHLAFGLLLGLLAHRFRRGITD